MADFGSNFTDAFSAVYGAGLKSRQQKRENARQDTQDAMAAEVFGRQKQGWEKEDAFKNSMKSAAMGGEITGKTSYLVPGTFTSADDALAAYKASLTSPTGQAPDYTQPAPKVGLPPMQGAAPPAFSGELQGMPNAAAPAALPPAAPPAAGAPPAQPGMRATQDLFGNWLVAPENEIRERSQAEVMRVAARDLMRQGYGMEALELRTKAAEARKLDVAEDHDRFTTALDGVTQALATGDAALVGQAAQGVLGALNQARDGIEYRYMPTEDGKGMQLKMFDQSTGMPAPGKGVVFPSIDPKTQKTADIQLLDYLKQFQSAAAFSDVYNQNVAFADRIADRAIKDKELKLRENQDKRQGNEDARQERLLPFQIAGLQASTRASNASAADSGSSYSKKDYATESAAFRKSSEGRAKELREADPSMTYQQSIAAAQSEVLSGMSPQFQERFGGGRVVDVPEAAAPGKPSAMPSKGSDPLTRQLTAPLTNPFTKKPFQGIPAYTGPMAASNVVF